MVEFLILDSNGKPVKADKLFTAEICIAKAKALAKKTGEVYSVQQVRVLFTTDDSPKDDFPF